MKIAVCQMKSSADPFLNLLLVNDFVKEATMRGAQIVFFPENVFYRGPKSSAEFSRDQIYLELDKNGQLLERNAFSRLLKEFSDQWDIFVSLGSVFEVDPALHKPFNSHFCFDPFQRAFASYRKIHLFDYQSQAGLQYKESDEVMHGEVERFISVDKINVGLSICYDLRFPELFRVLSLKNDCKILAIPAAFTMETGKVHWHTLLRARAIENQAFVVASAQWGTHFNHAGQELHCYGNSCVYSPWGDLLYCCDKNKDELALVELDMNLVAGVRTKLPSHYGAKFFHSKLSKVSQE